MLTPPNFFFKIFYLGGDLLLGSLHYPSWPIKSPKSWLVTSLHLWTKAAGKTVSSQSMPMTPVQRADAIPLHIAGGYSFRGAVLNCPRSFLPTDMPCGSSVATRWAWSSASNECIPKTNNVVGLAEGAPYRPCARCSSLTLGSSRIARRMGSLQMLTKSDCSGSLGCSTKPTPQRRASATIHWKANPNSKVPRLTCCSSLSLSYLYGNCKFIHCPIISIHPNYGGNAKMMIFNWNPIFSQGHVASLVKPVPVCG